MSFVETAKKYADEKLHDLKTVTELAELGKMVPEVKQLWEVAKAARAESKLFSEGLSKVEQAKEFIAAGKGYLEDAKKSALGEHLEFAGKAIALADAGIDAGKGVYAIAKNGIMKGADEAAKDFSTMAVNATVTGLGVVGTVVDKVGTVGLQAYAKHDLQRPLTETEKKDITFKNMASEGLKMTLKPIGEGLGDLAVEVHDAIHPENRYHSKPGILERTGDKLGDKAFELHEKLAAGEKKIEAKAHEVKDKVVETAHEVKDKVVHTAHEVKDKVVETAHEVKDKVVEAKEKVTATIDKAEDKAVAVGSKAMDAVLPPDVSAQAKTDLANAMAQPGTLNKVEGVGHAGFEMAKGLWHSATGR